MKIALVIGTRPQIIKSAPIIHASEDYSNLELMIIHTGQHYDYEMSRIFFNEMNLLDPIENLGIGSGPHAWQTGNMLIKLEEAYKRHNPDIVLVPGDTNSTLAGALAAVKLHIPVAHIESGARSFDNRMPEEINRILTDHCSEVLFAVSENCKKNLLNEGISEKKIIVSGDTMYENIERHTSDIMRDNALEEYGLNPSGYIVLTIHRPENVDHSKKLTDILDAVLRINDIPVVFPCHPRTKKKLQELNLYDDVSVRNNVKIIEPVGYYRMLNLIKNAQIVMTDSGGIQKEAFWLKTPCITLRESTEWIETVEIGFNTLTGSNSDLILKSINKIINYDDNIIINEYQRNPYYVKSTSNKILNHLLFSAI